jgi:hypothetical protein
MAEKDSNKKSFLGKFFQVLSGAPSSGAETEDGKGKFAPKEDEPLDVRFVRHFTESGGFFLYCGTKNELNDGLRDIIDEHNLLALGSPDENIMSFLKQAGIPKLNNNLDECDTICTYCEALMAFNGGIMVNENQTKGVKINNMPKYHIVIGKTSQLVENLSAAMTRVNQRYRENRPMSISTLRGPQDEQVKLASADPNKNRILFLLLIEDSL